MALNLQELCGWGRVDSKTARERNLEAQRLADVVASACAGKWRAPQAPSGKPCR